MNNEYLANGYFVVKNLFSDSELHPIRMVLTEFHEAWLADNLSFYKERAVNSAYITGKKYLDNWKREALFKFIASKKVMDVVYSVIPNNPAFVNTQLFFNPYKRKQENYWHRDCQYSFSIDEQKAILRGPEHIHLRVPLFPEPGIELVPGSHKRWDTLEELDVRLENNQHKNSESLSNGVKVQLSPGDLLVFSANMIHRGLYGLDRLSFDILFSGPEPAVANFIKNDCLPSTKMKSKLEDPSAFDNSQLMLGL